MPFLVEQVEIINKVLTENLFHNANFSGGAIYGLAEQVHTNEEDEENKMFPVFFNENEEPENISVDDTYPFIVYHRNIGNDYDTPDDDGFGDRQDKIVQTSEMVLIVYGKRSAIKLSADKLESFIILASPTNIDKELLKETPLDTMTASFNGSELDSLTVFSEEYQGIEFRISPEEFLFRVNYTVVTQYRKNCVKICC